jgi:hypothetical protein
MIEQQPKKPFVHKPPQIRPLDAHESAEMNAASGRDRHPAGWTFTIDGKPAKW